MPWLEKDEVLFFHVPRCGGTSLTKHHKVSQKAQSTKSLYYRIGLKVFFYRYALLESSNFPFRSYENAVALLQLTLATILFFALPGIPAPYFMVSSAFCMMITSTFIGTAPVLMRNKTGRRFLIGLNTLLCGIAADENYLVGINNKSYLLHITPEKCIRYGYLEKAVIKETSFAIVRNPYSRAVSMYLYNKRPCESFESYIRTTHEYYMKTYIERGKVDSWDIYCHLLPMHEYTHIAGEQVVKTIIKQENLKRLVATEWEGSDIPEKFQRALTDIPHRNARKKKMPWYEYYTQETMDLVLQMYEEDFDIFQYEKEIPNRDDLIYTPQSIARFSAPISHYFDKEVEMDDEGAGKRQSWRSDVRKSQKSQKRTSNPLHTETHSSGEKHAKKVASAERVVASTSSKTSPGMKDDMKLSHYEL